MIEKNISELKRQIWEKNMLLDSLSRDHKLKREKIRQIKMELDSLLYSYYKYITT